MDLNFQHSWNLTPKEAVNLQESLRSRVRFEQLRNEPKLIAGCDVSYDKDRPMVYAAIVLLTYPALTIVDETTAVTETSFPYIPGLLSFRESPAVLEAWSHLHQKPDILLVDGHGYAHPRRFGIACHLGVILDIPTIGCAKTVLVGRYEEPETARGSVSSLIHKNEEVGIAVRTRDNVRPVFVSVGHRVTLPEAVTMVISCSGKYRIPEPILYAHQLLNSIRGRKR